MNDPVLSFQYLYDARLPEQRVLRLQRMLRTLAQAADDAELNTAENGRYDAPTRAAVSVFQRKYGLPVTGRVDLPTWELLRQAWEQAVIPVPVPIRPYPRPGRGVTEGEYSDLAAIVQLMLETLRMHYDSIGPVPLSGRLDRAAADAVRAFQRASLLPETGTVDDATWNRLAAEYSRIAGENP